jgi:xanthine dehydrogenase YagT iron-sulfur-binding subunit
MAQIPAARTSLAECEMPGTFEAVESGAIPEVAVTMRINGRPERLQVDTRVTLLDALRDRLALTGRRRAATRAHAGHLPCWSTASACCPA